jgi:deoxyribonuclease-4
MLPDGRRLGAHLPLAGGMVRAAERAHAIGAATLQIFTDNPTAWQRRAEPPAELPAFRERVHALDLWPIAAHASYLINLAGPEPTFFERSIDLLAAELRSAPAFGVTFVNVHIGSHRDQGVDFGTRRVASAVAASLRVSDEGASQATILPILVLENSAGGGFGLGVDVTELAEIAAAIDAEGVPRDRVGFCLDVAHAWGAGIDMADPRAVDALLDAFDRRIGLDRLRMIHLNDSRSERGSRHDRHEHLGAGRIGAIGLGHLLCHPALTHVAYYLETPGMDEGYDAINMTRALAIAQQHPLDELPAAAFELRSSRARTAPA